MRFLVALHDVTPARAREVTTLWALCEQHDVRPALFVVPSWHGGHHLEEHPAFVRWITRRAEEGAEVFLHGERHDERGLRRGLGDALRAFGRTDGEGEFLTLRADEARRRIERGVRRFHALGLDPIGFVPPAWLARPETHASVSSLGLLFSEDDGRIHLHQRASSIPSPVVRWSARSAWRAALSVGIARVRIHLEATSPIRVALHPADLGSRVVRRSVERTLAACNERGPAIGYRRI